MIEAPPLTPADITRELALHLGESGPVLLELRRAVRELGPEACCDLAARALFIEATGGLMLGAPYNRRRTPGGIFFYLLKPELDDAQYQRVFRRPRRAPAAPVAAAPVAAPPVPAAPPAAVPPTPAVPKTPPTRPCANCGEQADVVGKLNISRSGAKRYICGPCVDAKYAFDGSGAVVQQRGK